MKKLLSIFMVMLCVLTITACSEKSEPTVVTYDQNTTQKTSSTEQSTTELTETESTEEVTETESTEEPTPSPTVVPPKYEVLSSSVRIQRDSVGNAWLNVLIEVKNVSEEAICLKQGTISVFANDTHVLTLEDAVCYPRVLEPGQVGYYFEQNPEYVDEDAQLHVEFESDIERANGLTQYVDENSEIYDSAFGVEVRGTYKAEEGMEGMMCVAAILFDMEQKPLAVLYDYIEAEANEYTLTSDKLPEGLSVEDISSHVVYVYPYAG